ncbi:hypothetical protein [Alkalihalobacillus trypoxylicola]|uniref:hypothetical protein n=1 Tax=Alkalihalobacillus trypoxylicola TaxID=519424 RepID=UPI000AFB88BE|nr:hypothetical protein [Alkalihalobacillus trypoxylicola]
MTISKVINALAKQLVAANGMNAPHDETAAQVIFSLADELGISEEVESSYLNYESSNVE